MSNDEKRCVLLKEQNDFENVEIKPKDRIIIKYKNGKMFLLSVKRVDDNELICTTDPNFIQETFINLNLLINRDLGKYIDYIILEKHYIKQIYSTQLNILIRNLEEARYRLVNAFKSNYFCDNKTILRDVSTINHSIALMVHDILLHEIR